MSDESEAAFQQAVVCYTLFGETLRPYSMSRKDAAERMGLEYPFLSTEDAQRLAKTHRYAGMKKDVAIVLWLCSVKNGDELTEETRHDWTPERAFTHPTEALMEAMRWTNEQAWADNRKPEFTEAAMTAFAIVHDCEVSDFYVKAEGPKGGKKKANTPSPTARKS